MVMIATELSMKKSNMSATDSGIVMLARELQPSKAQFPMWLTESPKVILAKEVQPAKA